MRKVYWKVSAKNGWGIRIGDRTIKAKNSKEARLLFFLKYGIMPYRAVRLYKRGVK